MNAPSPSTRLDYLDAVRAFALLLGIVFHAAISFSPIFMAWAVMDISTSPLVSQFILFSHSFRMELFFLLAGYFGRQVCVRTGSADFLRTRLIRLGVPFVVGWFLLHPMIISAWTMGSASLRGEVEVLAGVRQGFASLSTLPAGIFTGSHLWFLYYLLLVTAGTLAVRAMIVLSGASRQLSSVVENKLQHLLDAWYGLPILIFPTAVPLWFMSYWGVDTPDRSLVPHVPVLLLYGIFFLFGWGLQRLPRSLERLSRITWQRVLFGFLGGLLVQRLMVYQMETGHPLYRVMHVGFVVAYGTLMWTLICLTLGVFRRLVIRPRPAFRYLADASYWLYLIHLPIVAWLQVAVAELPFSWMMKLPLVVIATVGFGLLTYDAFVRSTVIGRILNGQRRERVFFRRRHREQAVQVPAVT